MALIKTGDSLTAKLKQPRGTYVTDGYGLITGKITYYADKSVGGTAVFGGQVHPTYSDLFVHSFTLSINELEISVIEAEYVGVASAIGTTTRPHVTASHGLTSEHIVTHPNFFGPSTGFSVAIAGDGVTFVASTINADYKVGGIFGAHFTGTATNAGGFVGFLDSATAAKQYYYGKNQYLAPTTSFSGSIYTTQSSTVTSIKAALGKTSATNSFSGVKLLPDHIGTAWTSTVKGASRNTILLSQASFEDYCVQVGGTPKIFKINYEIRYNREGYPAEVYAEA